jgi:hypothetical protein
MERLLQAQQQLHTFEAADSQVALERRLEARCRCSTAKLVDELGGDCQDPAFDVLLERHCLQSRAMTFCGHSISCLPNDSLSRLSPRACCMRWVSSVNSLMVLQGLHIVARALLNSSQSSRKIPGWCQASTSECK